MQRLVVFGSRVALRCDATADRKFDSPPLDNERADEQIEISGTVQSDVAQRPAVGTAWHGLECSDDLAGSVLGSTRHAATGRRRIQNVDGSEALPQPSCHNRNQMLHVAKPFQPAKRRDLHALGRADAGEIAAHQIHDHHILSAILHAGLQIVSCIEIGLGAGDHAARSLDGVHAHGAAFHLQKTLRRHADNLDCAAVEITGERGWICAARLQVERGRSDGVSHVETLREVDLENISGPHQFDSRPHHFEIRLLRVR